LSYPRPEDVRKLADEHGRQHPDPPKPPPPSSRELRQLRKQQEAELQRRRREWFAWEVRTRRQEIAEGIERAAKGGKRQVAVEIEHAPVARHIRDELGRSGYNVRLERVTNKLSGDPSTYKVRIGW
jgi:hypothetical protein